MSDLKAVMDFLEAQQGDRHFILMGICTGARNSQYGMTVDARVVGAVCIDGHIYKTPKYYLYLYAPKLFSLKSWITLLKMVPKKIMPMSSSKPDSSESKNSQNASAFRHTYQSKQQTEMDFKNFIDRNVLLHCIFTGNVCKYKNQLADNFKNLDFGENIEVTYLRNAEHIFPLIEDQENLALVITDWLNRNFSSQVY